ncbi:hypothetical protein L7F22_018271 [Adiantum nelumboides]|nr:hypothetical protein [Adiantum nelumboides]
MCKKLVKIAQAMMEPEPPNPPQETKPKSVGFEMPKAKVVETLTQRNIELESQKDVQAKTAAQKTNNLEIQLDDQVVANTTDDARSRSQFMAPIPEIDEPWPNGLWEAIKSAKDGNVTFQSAPIIEVNTGHEVYQGDNQSLYGDAGTEVSIESKPESLKTLPSYIREHEAKSKTSVVPSQRKSIPKMMDTANVSMELHSYTNANWAGSATGRRSTSGFIFTLGSAAITWRSKRHPTVALSNTEAEYRGAAVAACEVAWLRKLLMDLKLRVDREVVIYCDNLKKNSVFHARTKHIEIHYHFVQDQVLAGDNDLVYVSTEEQVADIFTKALGSEKLRRFWTMLGVLQWASSSRGTVDMLSSP